MCGFGLLSLSIILLSGCFSQKSPPIYFQLPINYVGAFALILDPREGINIDLQNGRYSYIIPTNGVLKIKSFDPFNKAHKEFAFYSDGKEISMDNSIASIPPNLIACRDTGVHDDPGKNNEWLRSIVYVIGTDVQKTEIQNKRLWRSLDPEYNNGDP